MKTRDKGGRYEGHKLDIKMKAKVRKWIGEGTSKNVILGRLMSQTDMSYGWAYKIYKEIDET